MKRCVILLSMAASAFAADGPAKNLILFLADAGGIPTLHGASIYAHRDPQKLFIHSMPHIGLSET